jgi:hypothetical protein
MSWQDFKVKKSRVSWKNKSFERGSTIRYQNAQLKRIKAEREKYKYLYKQVAGSLKMRGKRTAASHRERDVDFYLFTSVFVWTIGFRGISRVLRF